MQIRTKLKQKEVTIEAQKIASRKPAEICLSADFVLSLPRFAIEKIYRLDESSNSFPYSQKWSIVAIILD